MLAGLEHLDERYLRAVGYCTKSKRGVLPKMILLGDIAGEDAAAVAAATSEVVRLANCRSGEGFVAVSPAARRQFWLDRAKTAAIAKHTNAFKINEDVVIPLERLGEYTDAIERINIELSIQNKLELVDALTAYLSADGAGLGRCARAASSGTPTHSSCSSACARAGVYLLGAMDEPLGARRPRLAALGVAAPRGLRRHAVRAASGPQHPRELEIRAARRARANLRRRRRSHRLAECDALHRRVLQGRIFVALHMHAGDGNVHTNIPVNSDNYAMLNAANRTVARIMRIARQLNGVISGEHGIGITKLEHLTTEELAQWTDYKRRVDPHGRFNPAEARSPAAICGALTRRASGCWATSP